jgi:hypothetical protein
MPKNKVFFPEEYIFHPISGLFQEEQNGNNIQSGVSKFGPQVGAIQPPE